MSRVTQAVVLLAVVAAVLGMGVAVINAEYTDTPTHDETVENESLTQDVGNWTAVDAAGQAGVTGFYDNESVYNESGEPLDEGTDYEWAANGSVQFKDTASTTDGANATITYSYEQRPEQAAAMIGPLATVIDIAGVSPLVIAAGLAFFVVIQFKNATGGRGGRGSGGGRR